MFQTICPVLPMAGRARPLARRGIVAAQQMQERCASQSGGAVHVSLLVDEQRKTDSGLLAKQPGVAHVAQADRGKIRPLFDELLFMVAQLRNMLAAEHSAVVAQEHHDSRTLGTMRRDEPDCLSSRAGQAAPGLR